MTRIKGERQDSFDRLHHPDGTHRGTARSANGAELDWFEAHAQAHQAKHDESDDQFRVEWKYDDGDADGPNEFISGVTYTMREAERRVLELRDGDAHDIHIVPVD